MLTPDYFYGKSDKLIEMYQDLEDWILQDIASRLMAAGSLSGTADREGDYKAHFTADRKEPE